MEGAADGKLSDDGLLESTGGDALELVSVAAASLAAPLFGSVVVFSPDIMINETTKNDL